VLKILKEMLQHQSERFMPYVELTILRLLEFEKDTDKEVSECQSLQQSGDEKFAQLRGCNKFIPKCFGSVAFVAERASKGKGCHARPGAKGRCSSPLLRPLSP